MMNTDIEFIDTHAHLYSSQFDDDRDAMLQRAFDQGVKKIYLPNIDASSIDSMLKMETDYPGKCFPMMGLHPCSVTENFQEEMTRVETWLSKRRFVAIGEIGTDAYWDKTFLNEQEHCFRRQVELSKTYGIPIVIHSRETLDLNIRIISEMQDGSLRGIFHCFTGTVEQARQITDLGFLLGIGGVITFKNSGVSEVVAQLPIESMVLETDAPYLTPQPHRGKRNESAYLGLIAQKMAESLGLPLADVAKVTTSNAQHLFGS